MLKIEQLSIAYNQHPILENVNFQLEEGQIMAIVGQNGSGKSTLLKAIGGLIPKASGSVSWRGQDLSAVKPERLNSQDVSFMLQGGLIIPELTVSEHFRLTRPAEGRKGIPERVLSELPDLRELRDKQAGNLSGGQRQLLSIGLLLLQNAGLWLLDEPTAGLAPAMVEFVCNFLEQKNRRDGTTIVLVEHNYRVAFELAHTVAITKHQQLYSGITQERFRQKDFINEIFYH